MVEAERMVTCIFCGLRRPASEEDVISKWIRRTLDPASEVIIRAEPTGAVSRIRHLTVTLENMVCQECNNTWMSRLENRGVKPFLEPMLTSKHAATLNEHSSAISPAGQSSRCFSWSMPCGSGARTFDRPSGTRPAILN